MNTHARMLSIVQAPHSVLSSATKPVLKFDTALHTLLQKMEQALLAAKDPEGVGLAAPQVGKSIQLFVVRESNRSPLLIFINPKIHIPKKAKLLPNDAQIKEDSVKLEGCLSLKDVWGVVRRYDKVLISYLDETGKEHTKKFDGFLAIIIQHEVDHLNGILFPKRVLEQKGKLYKSKKDDKGKTMFEEIKL